MIRIFNWLRSLTWTDWHAGNWALGYMLVVAVVIGGAVGIYYEIQFFMAAK